MSEKDMCKAASEKDMKAYLCERNDWTPDTLERIDWEHLEVSLQRVFSETRTRFSRTVKLLHQIERLTKCIMVGAEIRMVAHCSHQWLVEAVASANEL